MKKSIYFSDKLQTQILPCYLDKFHSQKVKSNSYSFIRAICDYCKKDFLAIDALHAQSYFNFLLMPQQTGIKQLACSTIRLKHASLHAFSNYLIQNATRYDIEYVSNPFDSINIRLPLNCQALSKLPTLEQINSILQKCEREPVLYAALSLIIRCGLSVGELSKLRQDCFILDDANHAAIVFSYRKSQRYVKIPDDVLEILDHYWNSQVHNDSYLFENKSKHPMQVRDFERLYRKNMGTDFEYTLSDIRNSCLAIYYASGATSKEVEQYVGTKQYSWLRKYEKVIPELSLAPCDYSNLYIKLPHPHA